MTPAPAEGEAPSEGSVAGEGDKVAVHYTGTLDSGEEFDSSRGREPLSFVVGDGRMISGFDAAVRGMAIGETRTVRMEPAEAYGERNDDLVLTFPISQLPEGVGEGDSVVFTNGGQGTILEVTGETFTVDANHRLAGQALTFEIELVSIE
ncbi:MAG: FKBP-type peptidyl-prolyl cis-trans isomerase [Chloroflexota bacterium]|nr:FKBP-type peptidyl-prolyl cis-trans isomerase [Chloroflexota bacterium]MDE2941634.1 FKBP-type peptidyl-prolyl cis-trans isomerase [Chloroflexota bacterium]MDE3267253.1 FKBP-type peptidyl-prolyl cis-trans isomerase [Chloroflexota bacterium]